MSKEEIHQLVTSLGGLVHILKAVDPTDKLEVYRQLGLKLTYDHENGWSWLKLLHNHPCAYCLCPEGDLNPHAR
ncbi:hypothetical protein [Nocardia cyriacigeorgica]|uniref:hypothetical protein n=1 Tax=Nocardia cyriacigeorgica TaxID=135487 RepID=UPI0018934C36|nr:hypothetical protein [Nocardia cyriacigeorgica]MBF6090148.1 hypothetical protein [Nocardia cyriacigeorgica]MBF6094671.1 hypothetical protein [Nocardia cyriacigeorgica]